jgi:hypothetical protein
MLWGCPCALRFDNFVKSPSAALRFFLSHCGVQHVRLISSDVRALHLELFTLLSVPDFLRLHQGFIRLSKNPSDVCALAEKLYASILFLSMWIA